MLHLTKKKKEVMVSFLIEERGMIGSKPIHVKSMHPDSSFPYLESRLPALASLYNIIPYDIIILY